MRPDVPVFPAQSIHTTSFNMKGQTTGATKISGMDKPPTTTLR